LRILIVGSGGREHALAWRLKQSPQLTGLWVANGNAGTAQIATNLDVNPEDVDGVAEAARSLSIDLVVVGPELPLAHGIVDRLDSLGIPAFGPTQAAAQIEVSKSFAREVMREAAVPGPEFWVFHNQQEALEFVSRHQKPVVVKANGLAAGKGVALCPTPEDAATAVRACMGDRIFGPAGETVVIEEFLSGAEVSVFAFSDGERLSPLAAACDYKRVGDSDTGPNTGGMGSFGPPDFWNDALADEVTRSIMRPIIETLRHRGTPYKGVLYAGLMLTETGPKVLEFNCRFGDPEAQVVLPLLEDDLLEIMLACIEGRLDQLWLTWQKKAHVGVVMTSGGYPAKYETGFEITGLDSDDPNSLVFHAGTQLVQGGNSSRVITSGGRVLTVVGWGNSLDEARARAYDRVRKIHFNQAYYRTDIGEPRMGDREKSWVSNSSTHTS
jgi:phosphoribosylamine---glycine ligase